MTSVNTSSTTKTSPIFNAPRIQRRFNFFSAEVEITPAHYVARDRIIIQRKGYERKGKQWSVSLIRGFEVRPKYGEQYALLSRAEAKAQIAKFKAERAAA